MDHTLILVDENDNKIGYAQKEECHTGDGKHHRAFALLIINKDKNILLQKRKHKRWDNFWDVSGASDIHHENGKDETYEDAGRRCLRDEWNFVVPLQKIFGYNYFERYNDMCENEYCALLVGEYNGHVAANPDHARGFKWISFHELIENIEKHPEHYTPWAIVAVEQLKSHDFAKKLL